MTHYLAKVSFFLLIVFFAKNASINAQVLPRNLTTDIRINATIKDTIGEIVWFSPNFSFENDMPLLLGCVI
jgi:hypothetical protein